MIEYLRHYTEIDGQRSLQIVALDITPDATQTGYKRIIGGGTLVDIEGPKPVIYAMHVLAVWRGQGIGSQIVKVLVDELKLRADRPPFVYTIARAGNVDAIRFYERHGFVVREPNDDQYKRLILTKALG